MLSEDLLKPMALADSNSLSGDSHRQLERIFMVVAIDTTKANKISEN